MYRRLFILFVLFIVAHSSAIASYRVEIVNPAVVIAYIPTDITLRISEPSTPVLDMKIAVDGLTIREEKTMIGVDSLQFVNGICIIKSAFFTKNNILRFFIDTEVHSIKIRVIPGWLSLLPPLMAILLALIALIATMTFSTLGYALSRMPIPDKFVHLLLMTYRYIFVIEQEYQRLIRAVQIRGFRPRTNMHTYKTYAYIIGMLFVRSSLRADRVYKAMLCRGFKNKFYCLQEFSAGCKEWIFITATGIFTGMLAYLEWLRAVY